MDSGSELEIGSPTGSPTVIPPTPPKTAKSLTSRNLLPWLEEEARAEKLNTQEYTFYLANQLPRWLSLSAPKSSSRDKARSEVRSAAGSSNSSTDGRSTVMSTPTTSSPSAMEGSGSGDDDLLKQILKEVKNANQQFGEKLAKWKNKLNIFKRMMLLLPVMDKGRRRSYLPLQKPEMQFGKFTGLCQKMMRTLDGNQVPIRRTRRFCRK